MRGAAIFLWISLDAGCLEIKQRSAAALMMAALTDWIISSLRRLNSRGAKCGLASYVAQFILDLLRLQLGRSLAIEVYVIMTVQTALNALAAIHAPGQREVYLRPSCTSVPRAVFTAQLDGYVHHKFQRLIGRIGRCEQ